MNTSNSHLGFWEKLCHDRFILNEESGVSRRQLVGKIDSIENSTTNQSKLRSWVYSDVHLRSMGGSSIFAGPADVECYLDISKYTYNSTGWEMKGSILFKPSQYMLQADSFIHKAQNDGLFCVQLPRLRFHATTGWLSLASDNESNSDNPWRLYLPGVSLKNLSTLIDFLDSQRYLKTWSMKTSLGLDNTAALVKRPDCTVVYFDPHEVGKKNLVRRFIDDIASLIPPGIGPGFSLEVNESVWIGGPGSTPQMSFGSSLADLASKCILRNDFYDLNKAENQFNQEVTHLVG